MKFPDRNSDGTFPAGRPVKRYRMQTKDGELQLVHRIRAELALGKPLPPDAVVHHADGSKNEHAPLVICQDESYHRLLHARMRIKAFGGDPNLDRVCHGCQTLKPIDRFQAGAARFGKWHCLNCPAKAEYQRQRRAAVSA